VKGNIKSWKGAGTDGPLSYSKIGRSKIRRSGKKNNQLKEEVRALLIGHNY